MEKERRLNLHEELCELLGTRNVYFQPPENVKIKYPCFIYHRQTGDSLYADNDTYRFTLCYELIYVDRDPDTDMVEKTVNHFRMIKHTTFYTADNLNHDVFLLYY